MLKDNDKINYMGNSSPETYARPVQCMGYHVLFQCTAFRIFSQLKIKEFIPRMYSHVHLRYGAFNTFISK